VIAFLSLIVILMREPFMCSQKYLTLRCCLRRKVLLYSRRASHCKSNIFGGLCFTFSLVELGLAELQNASTVERY